MFCDVLSMLTNLMCARLITVYFQFLCTVPGIRAHYSYVGSNMHWKQC